MTSQTTPATRCDTTPTYRRTSNRRAGSARHARHRQLTRRQRPQRSTIHSQTVTYGPRPAARHVLAPAMNA